MRACCPNDASVAGTQNEKVPKNAKNSVANQMDQDVVLLIHKMFWIAQTDKTKLTTWQTSSSSLEFCQHNEGSLLRAAWCQLQFSGDHHRLRPQ